MNKYLWRISLKPSNGWSKYYNQTVKPAHLVSRTKEETLKWAEENTVGGVSVKAVSRVAKSVFTGDLGNSK